MLQGIVVGSKLVVTFSCNILRSDNLTFTTVWAESADGKLIIFLIFSRNQILRFYAKYLLRKQLSLFSENNKKKIF